MKAGDFLTSFYIGRFYEEAEMLDRAVYYYLDALEQQPLHVPSLAHLGGVYVKEYNVLKASGYLKRAYNLDPSNANVVDNIGVCYLQLGQLA